MAGLVPFPVAERTENGYLALPEQGTGGGVLVLHAWWGVNDFFKTVCDRLAREGFVAFAPDLFHGKIATTIDEAEHLRDSLDDDSADQEITGAIEYLLAQPATRGQEVGVIGFSLGSYWALLLEEHVKAIVTFYGLSDTEKVKAQAAFLGHFAEHDEFESVEDVHLLEKRLRDLGREVSFTIYPGTQHWFFEENRPDVYNAEAAKQAWEKTVAFLHRHLATG